MQQAIIWTNDGEFTDVYMCHSAQWVKQIPDKLI